MNVNGISSSTSIAASAAPSRAPTERTAGEIPAEPTIDKTTGQPMAPRFPWLSRITAQLEKVSSQGSPYGTVPLIGENLDKAV